MSVLSGAAFFLGTPSEWGLAPNVLVAGGVFVGTGLLLQVIRDQYKELGEKSRMLDERDVHRAGLKEFGQRVREGNELAKKLGRWPKIVGDGETLADRRRSVETQTKQRRAEYAKATSEWNLACVATVDLYLPGRGPVIERPIVRSEPPRTLADRTVFRLREEVDQKIDRMIALQKEHAAQSSSAAISSQVQT